MAPTQHALFIDDLLAHSDHMRGLKEGLPTLTKGALQKRP